jgi:hypothetical protein
VPVDENWEVAAVSGPLKKYEVTTPSGVTTTMKLSEEDAERLGVLQKQAAAPAETEHAAEPATEAPSKRQTPRNKRRTAADKDGGGDGGND